LMFSWDDWNVCGCNYKEDGMDRKDKVIVGFLLCFLMGVILVLWFRVNRLENDLFLMQTACQERREVARGVLEGHSARISALERRNAEQPDARAKAQSQPKQPVPPSKGHRRH